MSPYERWMVASNLRRIADGAPEATVVAQLRANGYERVANEVQRVLDADSRRDITMLELRAISRGEEVEHGSA